ncbi:GNAT family N-acetyltransferase [Agrobacterium sp. ES01]|uniref:GNAT family N-acetyltransferase n=1 Tax=Agrobacterium sp. ES01 TaxID=3420714 RepID=UPI003D0B9A00
MEIRQCQPGDVDKLLTLYRELQPDDPELPVSDAVARLEQLHRLPASGIFLGWIGAEPVTTCMLVVIPNLTRGGAPYALIENVVTANAYRRRGYGKLILQSAIEAAWQTGCYKVMLLTGSTRPETLAFYEAAGFEQSKTGFQIRRVARRAQ